MKHLLFILLSCLLFNTGYGQRSYRDAIGFSQHLVKLQKYDDAVKVLKQVKLDPLNSVHRDSLEHLIGFAYYLGKNLDSSVFHLDKVSSVSELHDKSAYYSVIGSLYKGRQSYSAAETRLFSIQPTDELRQLWLTEYGGLLLLERDYRRYDSISRLFDHSFYAVVNEQAELDRYYQRMLNAKSKSPFVAGALSAAIPGMGKLYAGYRGKALSSFISVTSLALVAGESYYRNGFKSPSFIIFSSLFSVFYVGNIWGSVLSVKIKQDENFREFDRNILLDLHIPLRRIYN